jgi:hypothetical protein
MFPLVSAVNTDHSARPAAGDDDHLHSELYSAFYLGCFNCRQLVHFSTPTYGTEPDKIQGANRVIGFHPTVALDDVRQRKETLKY